MHNSSGPGGSCTCESSYTPEKPDWWYKLTATEKAEHQNWEAKTSAEMFSSLGRNIEPDLIEGIKSVCHTPFKIDKSESNSKLPFWRAIED